MGVIGEMDYRLKNPNSGRQFDIDKKIVETFISKQRDMDKIEKFRLWVDISKERNNILPIINQYYNDMVNQYDNNLVNQKGK